MFSLVFVCLFTEEGSHVTITHDALDLTVQAPALPPLGIRHGTPNLGPAPTNDIWWLSLETCLHLFTWRPPNQHWHLVAEPRTVGKWVVHILQYCLVEDCFVNYLTILKVKYQESESSIFILMKRSNESDFILQNNQIQINFRDCFPQSDLNPVNSQIWVGENSLKVSLILQQPLWGNSGIFVSIYILLLSIWWSEDQLWISKSFHMLSVSQLLTEFVKDLFNVQRLLLIERFNRRLSGADIFVSFGVH